MKIEELVKNILDDLRSYLTLEDVTNVEELINHREWGVALEIICTQLEEYETVIPNSVFRKIENAGNMMGLDPILWECIKGSDPI